jgi:hypothetical protein
MSLLQSNEYAMQLCLQYLQTNGKRGKMKRKRRQENAKCKGQEAMGNYVFQEFYITGGLCRLFMMK